MKNYLCIDIGGTYTKYAILDENCQFIEKGKQPTRQESEETFVEMLCDIAKKYEDVSGLAICSAGVIDSEKGLMHNGGSLSVIHDLDIVARLEEHLHKPVTIINDARSALLAEVWQGALSGCRSGVAVIIGTAVGGAIVYNHVLLQGSTNMAGELSYVIGENRRPMAEIGGVGHLIEEASQLTGQNLTSGEEVFHLARAHNQEAIAAINHYAYQLALLINNLHFIVNPEKIVIGGGISEEPIFMEAIGNALKEVNAIYPFEVGMPVVEACHYHNDANLIGALYYHLTKQDKIKTKRQK
ncbi:ROK family protein [Sharpea azabuensis]